jgi:hypothetical protein
MADVSGSTGRDAALMSMTKVLVGFVPWIVFSLVATRVGPGAVGAAAGLAFLVAVGLIIRSVIGGHSPKVLEVSGAVVFLAFTVLAVTTPALDPVLADYGRSIAAAVLAVIIIALLPVMPFTEQYARETVPRQYWHTPQFRSVNRRISAAWGGIVAVMAVGHAIAGTFEVPDPGAGLLHRPVDLVFNWLIPGLLVWWAARYTQRVSAAAKAPAPAPAAQPAR